MKNLDSFKVALDTNIHDVLKIIDRKGGQIALVVDTEQKLLGTVTDDKPQVVIVVTKDLIKNGIFAGNIAKEVGKTMGGGGGGKPHLATSGGQNSDKLNSAIDSGKVMAKSLILHETNGS